MIQYNKEKCTPLEQFMIEISLMLDCLPSFADPSLDGGNSHIKKRLKILIDSEKKYNQSLELTEKSRGISDKPEHSIGITP